MSLHSEIMNIPTKIDFSQWLPLEKNAYNHGHRDARHAAAEIILKYETELEDLRAFKENLKNWKGA